MKNVAALTEDGAFEIWQLKSLHPRGFVILQSLPEVNLAGGGGGGKLGT